MTGALLFWHAKLLTDIPKFGEPIQNQTIAVGREAFFACVVDNLQTYKVSKHENIFPSLLSNASKLVVRLRFIFAIKMRWHATFIRLVQMKPHKYDIISTT